MPAMTLQGKEEEFKGLALFVCTHASRDCRCGTIGTDLARRLQTLVEEQGLDLIQVYQVSHVGGHKVCITTAPLPQILGCDLQELDLADGRLAPHLIPACPRPRCRFRHSVYPAEQIVSIGRVHNTRFSLHPLPMIVLLAPRSMRATFWCTAAYPLATGTGMAVSTRATQRLFWTPWWARR